MNCRELEDLLADYLGEELGGSDRARVESHLTECDACRAEVDSLRGGLAALQESPDVGADEASRRTADLEVRRRSGRMARLAWTVGGAAAALLVGLAIGWRLGLTQVHPVPAPDRPALHMEPGIHPAWRQAIAHAFGGGGPKEAPSRR